jgi:transposase-like protein
MRIAQLWLAKASRSTSIILTGHSSRTITAFYGHFRTLVASALKEEDQIIGGVGIVVEVDETKLGKRKYNRGHYVDGVWVVVGIERQEKGKVFLVPVRDRSADTLHDIIKRHILPGTTINTDLWRGYRGLEELGMVHQAVNHSEAFKDPETFACTNTVEGLNSGLKRFIPVRNRVCRGIEMHLGEYVWRRQNSLRLFDAFVDALRDIHYDFE